jgi:hypothetical protein
MKWENATVPMRDPSQLRSTELDAFLAEIVRSIHGPDTTEAAQIQEIMDVKYAPAGINDMVSKCNNLTNNERSNLKRLLKKLETLFDGTLATWDTEPIDLDLKDPDAKPYHARPYLLRAKSTALNGHHQCLRLQRKIKPSDPSWI